MGCILTSPKFKEFGWQGFLFEIPVKWALIKEGGTSHSGNLSFRAGTSHFELEWKPLDGKTPSPLRVVAERFIEEIRKDADGEAKIRKGAITIRQHKALLIRFKTDVEGQIFFWYCKPSERFLMMKFVSKKIRTQFVSTIRRIIKSFRCHGLEKRIWSAFGFRLELSKFLELKTRKFVVGQGTLVFQDEKKGLLVQKGTSVLLEYFSMADVRFGESCVDSHKWLNEYYLERLKKRYGKLKLEKVGTNQVQGHHVDIDKGDTKSGLAWRRKAKFLTASWHCPNMNRMYTVTVGIQIMRPIFLRREIYQEDLERNFEHVLESIHCH